MRFWKSTISILLCIALAACARAPGAFAVRSAALDGAVLIVRSDWRPDAQVLDIPNRDHMRAVGDKVYKTGVLEFLSERR